MQQQENNDIIADSTPEAQTAETAIEEAPQAAEESDAITPAAETQEAAVQLREAPDVDTPELQGFSERQIEKFKTKPKIKLSKKDYAKVSQARTAKYAGLSGERIPMLDVFPIAEYGQIDTGYKYIVRNVSGDVFEVVGKYKIKNEADIKEEAYHDAGRRAETQRSNQAVNQENTEADGGGNWSDSGRTGHGDADGRVYGVADNSEESAVHEHTDDIVGDSGAYLTSEEETQSTAEAEQPQSEEIKQRDSNVEIQWSEVEYEAAPEFTEDDYTRSAADSPAENKVETVASVMKRKDRESGTRRIDLGWNDTRKTDVNEFFGKQYERTIKRRFGVGHYPSCVQFEPFNFAF